jgi:hypothetical protein
VTVTAEEITAWAEAIEDQLGLDRFFVALQSSGDLKLYDIIVPKDRRNEGIGSRAMTELNAFADAHGLRVILSPGQPGDPGGPTSRARLVRFYKRYGYVENKGRKKDFSISAGMYRLPTRSQKVSKTKLEQWLDAEAANYIGYLELQLESMDYDIESEDARGNMVTDPAKLLAYVGEVEWDASEPCPDEESAASEYRTEVYRRAKAILADQPSPTTKKSATKTPPAAWIARFVRAAALNTLASRGAPMRIQQRMHKTFINMLTEGQHKWPHVDFQEGLDRAIADWLAQRPMSGPGKDW